MSALARETRFAIRRLLKAPGFSLVVVVTLALGIGANTAIFSVISAVLFRPLPYPEPDRLVMFWEKFANVGIDYVPINEGALYEWKEQQQVFKEMAGFRIRSHATGRPVILTGDWTPQRVNGIMCSYELFSTLQVEPILGRDFREGEDLPGAAPVVILSHGFWLRLFGGDPAALGRTLHLDGTPHEIVGVMPPGFFFPPPLKFGGNVREGAGEIFFPYPFRRDFFGVRTIRSVARLNDGISISAAEAALQPIAEELFLRRPDASLEGPGAVLLPLHEQAVDLSRGPLMLLAGAVGAILLIACLNVANLLLALTTRRQREIAVRVAIGAARSQIVRLLLCETFVLALAGGVVGVSLAHFGLPPLMHVSSRYIPNLGPVSIDPRVLGFAFGLTLLTGLAIGLFPALRVSCPTIPEDLKEGARGTTGSRRSDLLRKGLVVVEVAAATILLVGAGLLLRSLWKAQEVDLGFESRGRLVIQTWLPPGKYEANTQVVNFYEQVLEELRSAPGVKKLGAVNILPFSQGIFGGNFEIESSQTGTQRTDPRQVADFRIITGEYLQSLGIEVMAGRDFLPTDRADSVPVALIDEGLAEQFWPGGGWEGSRIKILQEENWRTIVGVVREIRHKSYRTGNQGLMYVPLAQTPHRQMALVFELEPGPADTGELRRRIELRDRDLALEIRPLESFVSDAHSGLRSPSILIGLMAVLAVVLALVGLYGLISYLMGHRTHEIGIRLALGAERADIFRMVGWQATVLVVSGVFIGLLGALGLSRLLSSFLFGVTGADLPTYVFVSLLFLIVAGLATFVPLNHASRLNPVEALRTE